MCLDHPTITATATDSQTEPDRIARLARVYGYAMALADGEGGADLPGKLNQLHDHKDTLIVFWHGAPSEAEKDYFQRAWPSRAGDGSLRVEHEF